MTDPALDALDAWPWPRWEFVSAMPTDDGITVALAPVADPEPIEVVYDSGWIDMMPTDARHDGIGDNVCWFCAAGPCTSACARALEDGRLGDLDAALDRTWDIERAAPSEAVRKAAHDLRWALVEHRAATEPAPTVGPVHGKHTDLDAYCRANGYDITGRTVDSTGAEVTFDG